VILPHMYSHYHVSSSLALVVHDYNVSTVKSCVEIDETSFGSHLSNSELDSMSSMTMLTAS